MTDTEDNAPGEWFEIAVQYSFQQAAWRNGATGNVLVIEEKEEQWHDDDEGPDISVFLLPQEWEDNPEPIEEICTQEKDPSVALRTAWKCMGESPGSQAD